TDRADPSPISSNQGGVRIVSGNLSDNQRNNDADRTDRTHDCPNGGDPIEPSGSLKLGRPDIAFGGLLRFLTAMDFPDKGVEPRPFGRQHVVRLLVAVGGCVFFLPVAPIILRSVWHRIQPSGCRYEGGSQIKAH